MRKRSALAIVGLFCGLSNSATAENWMFPSSSSHNVMAAQDKCKAESQESIWVWLPQHESETVAALLQGWQAHPLANFASCLKLRHYARKADLQCAIAGERQHQRCQLPLLPRELMQRHIVFTEVKTASTSTMQMVLPIQSDVSLFAHEMAHWLGFADEYPMSPSLAEPFCTGRYQHPSLNVVLTERQVLSATQLQELWQGLPWRHAVQDWRQLGELQADGNWRLGSNDRQTVGLFASRTCAAVEGVYSWKPVADMTAMEYHDVNYWPTVYLDTVSKLQRSRRLRDHDNRAQ